MLIYHNRSELKAILTNLKEYGIDRFRSINSIEEFSRSINEKSTIEIQRKVDVMKRLNKRYGVLI